MEEARFNAWEEGRQEFMRKGNLSLPGMVPMATKTKPLNLSRVYQGEGI